MNIKHQFNWLFLLVCLFGFLIPNNAQAQREINQLQFGKQEIIVAPNEEIVFYDWKGTESINSSSSNNSQSLTVFKPQEVGMSVQITFEKTDVKNDGTNYPGYINVYNGVADADNSFVWATKTTEVTATSKMPEGNIIEKLDGNFTNKTYYSSSSDGALSIGMLWRYAKKCDGWVAKVKAIKLENMQIKLAKVDYSNIISNPTQRKNVALASFSIATEGVLNADTLTTIKLNLPINENLINPLTLKLYSGQGSYFNTETPISTQITQDGNSYIVTLNSILQSGNNWFTIVGNLENNASIGAKASVAIQLLTTKKLTTGITTLENATPVEIINPNIVLMDTNPQTIMVGNTPINFYDEGGKDGDTTADFQGTITFKPTDSGKKVKINFNKVEIFEGSIYKQYIKVYNGTEVKDENLIATVTKGKPIIIKSTSNDGALTVVTSSNTKTTSNGFEAVVEQFTPQAMMLKEIKVEQIAGENVYTGDKNQPILSVNINTSETEPALSVSSFKFTTNSTYNNIEKATLYSTKASNAFNTATKVGEVNVTSNEFTINITSQNLIENNNYFFLAYDIKDNAQDKSKIDASLTSITLSNEEKTPTNGNPDGDRTVENVVFVKANMGRVIKTVYGNTTVKTLNANNYSEKYEPGTDDRIVTFIPSKNDTKCQIDFSKFALTYSSSTWGAKAKFKIFAGDNTNGTLLWELSKKEDSQVGPGKPIRSTSENGALTILFSPNESTSNYVDKGFEAIVIEYKEQSMLLKSATATQSSTELVSFGAKKQQIINVNINTQGNQNPLNLTAINVNLKGSQNNISNVYLYPLSQNEAEPDTNTEPLATLAVNKTSDNNAKLTLTTPKTLLEGDNNFCILYDISSEAVAEEKVDAELISVECGDKTTIATNGNPDGERTIKYIIVMNSGENGTIYVPKGGKIMFYDDGGANGNESKNFKGNITFTPIDAKESIKLIFKEWTVLGKDTIYIYNGSAVLSPKQAAKYYGRYDKPMAEPFISNADDGSVSIRFVTGNYTTTAGFAIEVVALEKKSLYFNGVNTTNIAPKNVMKGENNVQMIQINVDVKGDKDKAIINNVKFDGVSTDVINNIAIYTTDTTSTYSPVNMFGQSNTNPYIVNGNYEISKEGNYKLWAAIDVKTTAKINDIAKIKVASITINNEEKNIENTQEASTQVIGGVSGTYIVEAGTTYPTIQSAIDAVSNGVDGPVVINIKPGIYNELVNVPHIKGLSNINTLTIKSETNNYEDVKIYHNKYDEPAYSDDKMFQEYGVFTISGGDYVTLKGLDITTTDVTFPGVIHIKNVSRNVTIDSCYIHAEMTTEYRQDINLISTYSKNEANSNNDFLKITNNLIEGGYIGVNMGGTGYVRLPKEVGGVIEGNTFKNQGSKAIYVMDELGAKIRFNVIENTKTTKSGFQGIDSQLRDAYNEPYVIEGNIINLATTNGVEGIDLRQIYGTPNSAALVINNEINIVSENNSSNGISFSKGTQFLNIANNTVRISGQNSKSCLYVGGQSTNVNVVNNILQNETNGYVYRMNKAEYKDGVEFSNNSVYNTNNFAYNGNDIATFDNWKVFSNEQNSYNDSVVFVSNNVLEPADKGNLVNGLKLDYVKTDLNNNARAEVPTIGAYEYYDVSQAPKALENYPTTKNITKNSANIVVAPDMTCEAYVVIKELNDAEPTEEEIMNSTIKTTLHKNKEGAIMIKNLTENEVYVGYIILKNFKNMKSITYKTSPFKASSTEFYEPPTPKVSANNITIEKGEEVTLKAIITEGTKPYTITWYNGKHEVIGTTKTEQEEYEVKYTPNECDDYFVNVKDANNKEAKDTCRVIVKGESVTATFENLYIENESFWNGSDNRGSFVSGTYMFENGCMPEYSYWYNFAYSNKTATTFVDYKTDQFNSAVGSGYNNSENYVVAYPQGGKITILNTEEGDSIRGFYITNNAWAVNAITVSDGMTQGAFKEGDFFKVTITGVHKDGTNTTLDYYLADYRDVNSANHYYLDTWQWVDLRSLGKVTDISFKLSSSRSNNYGMTTPAYFCMDNFNGERVVKDVEKQTVEKTIDVSQFFTFDSQTASVSYVLADEIKEELKDKVTLTNDGQLTVNAQNTKFDIVVSATQKGKIQFVRIPILIPSMIENISMDNDNIEGIYSIDGKKLYKTQRGVNIIKYKNGEVRKISIQ